MNQVLPHKKNKIAIYVEMRQAQNEVLACNLYPRFETFLKHCVIFIQFCFCYFYSKIICQNQKRKLIL